MFGTMGDEIPSRLTRLEARLTEFESSFTHSLLRFDAIEMWQRNKRMETAGLVSRIKTLEDRAGIDPRSVPGHGLAQAGADLRAARVPSPEPTRSGNPFRIGTHRGPGALPTDTRAPHAPFDVDELEKNEARTQTGKSLSMPAPMPAPSPTEATSVVMEATVPEPQPTFGTAQTVPPPLLGAPSRQRALGCYSQARSTGGPQAGERKTTNLGHRQPAVHGF